jgi:hypothetical protein
MQKWRCISMMRITNTIKILFVCVLLFNVCNLGSTCDKPVYNYTIESYNYPLVFCPAKYTTFVYNLCEDLDIDVDLFCAVIATESGWYENAINFNRNSFDYGLGQINSMYEDYYVNLFRIKNYNRANPKHNLLLSANILKWSMKGFDEHEGVMAYNCGRGAVIRNTIPERTLKYKKIVYKKATIYRLIRNSFVL